MSTPPAKIQVTCSCGTVFAVSPERAGAAVACPKCARPVALPAAGGASWFVARSKQRAGPYSSAQLKGMVASGQLRAEDMLLREGQRQWVQAGTVRGLFPEPVSAEAAPGPRSAEGPAPGRPKRRRTLGLLIGAAAVLLLMTCAGGGLFLALTLATLTRTVTPSPQANLNRDKQDPFSTHTVPAAPTNGKGTERGTPSPRAEPVMESTTQDKLLGRWEATRGEIPPGSVLELTRDGKLKMTIKVEGVVKDVFVNKMGEAIVYLKGATDRPGVACSFEPRESQEAAKVPVGQKIIVAGKGYGILGDDVLLGFCKLLPGGGKPDPK